MTSSIRPAPALALLLLVLDLCCWRAAAGDRAAALVPAAGLDDLLGGLAAVALQAALAWLTLLALLAALEPLAGRPLTAYAGCPPAVRVLLVGGCGLVATATLVAPAGAVDDPGQGVHVASVAGRLDGLRPPDRALGGVSEPRAIVVRRGDCLWSLARARLGLRASDGEVDRLWRATYAVNRARIGPDPDLVRPGTHLVPPEEHL